MHKILRQLFCIPFVGNLEFSYATHLRFAQNFEATFLHTFCRQLRSLDIFFSYATHLTFAQNFEAAFLPTFCRQLRSLDIFDWNLWLQLLFAQIFCLFLPTFCGQLRIVDIALYKEAIWQQYVFWHCQYQQNENVRFKKE